MDDLLGKRIDTVNELLKQPLTDWARNYWTTVQRQLLRQLNVKNIKDTN